MFSRPAAIVEYGAARMVGEIDNVTGRAASHRVAGFVADFEFAGMFAGAEVEIRDSSERLGQINADPELGQIAAVRRLAAQTFAVDDHNAKTIQSFRIDFDLDRAVLSGLEAIALPRAAGIAGAPDFDLRNASGTGRFYFVVERKTAWELTIPGSSSPAGRP